MLETILLTAMLAVAQPQAPPIAKDLPKAKISKVAQMSEPVAPSYRDGADIARAKNMPMVVFLFTPARKVEGVVVVLMPKVSYTHPAWGEDPGIIISRPNPKTPTGMEWVTTLPANATDAQIRRAAGVVESRQLPFFKAIQDRRDKRTADAEPNARQLPTWFPKDAIRYHHAERTQSLSTTDNQHNIVSVPRTSLERKWLFPGGLADVGGWESDLYKSAEVEPYLAFLPALNSGGSYQLEAGWYRSYPDGAWFADVLSKDGKIFEIRIREKIDGAWDSYVEFRDPANYPNGYVPIKSSKCMACHQQAGQAKYNGAAIPGADTVISDPFPDLESRDGSRFFGPNRFFGQIANGFLTAREYRR